MTAQADTTGKVFVISSEKSPNFTVEKGKYSCYGVNCEEIDLNFTQPVLNQSTFKIKGKKISDWQLWSNESGSLGDCKCEKSTSDIITEEIYNGHIWKGFYPYLYIKYNPCRHQNSITLEKTNNNYLTGTCSECDLYVEVPIKVYEANKQPIADDKLANYDKVTFIHELQSKEFDLFQTIDKNYDNDINHISKWEIWRGYGDYYTEKIVDGSGKDKIGLSDFIRAINFENNGKSADVVFPIIYREYEDHTYVNGACSGCGRPDPTYTAPPKEDKPTAGTEDKGAEPAKKGTKLTPAGETTTYKVTKSGTNPTVMYTKADKKARNVVIPETIKDKNGVSYTVTEIASGAFKNNKSLKIVTIGANIEKIGKNAFSGCKNLKTVTIKSKKITSIEKNAFKGISKNAKISVPKNKKKTYTKLLKKSKYTGKIK